MYSRCTWIWKKETTPEIRTELRYAWGMHYVAHLPHHTELYLVMPVRQWDERDTHQ
jgi:hypothetical protein